MARKRKGKPIHGWLIIDKPLGLSSSAVVGKVRRLTDAAKAGHGGTLDPLATGILPIALGEATKTVSYVMDGTKVYRFTLKFGEATETDDSEGDVVETSEARPTDDEILAGLALFTGEIEQIPPIYSAVKVDGKRAYALARDDQEVELKSRIVQVDRFEMIERPDPDHATFEVTCGKGTYIRSLGRDLARHLGTVGHVAMLRRTAVGPFGEKDTISLESLAELGHSAPLSERLLPIETALDDIPALALTEVEARRLRLGQALQAMPILSRSPLGTPRQDDVVVAMEGSKPVALVRLCDGEIKPLRVLNL